MKRSQWPLILALAAFGLALLSGFYAYNRLFKTVPAVAVVSDQPAGTALTDNMVEIIRIPAGGRPPEALFGPGQVSGMYAAAPLFAGEILSSRHLTATPPAQDPLTAIGPGQRVVSIPVRAETVLDGALRSGDLVDVVAVWPGKEGTPGITQVLAPGVRVVDMRSSSGLSASSEHPDRGPQSAVPTTALLLVKSEQAHTLVAAVEAQAAIYLWLTEREGK